MYTCEEPHSIPIYMTDARGLGIRIISPEKGIIPGFLSLACTRSG